MAIDTESKIDFDYSVSTEDRFALRKWFEDFVAAQNRRDAEAITGFLDESVSIEGLGEGQTDFATCKEFVAKQCNEPKFPLMRYPLSKVKFQHVFFSINGDFEGYYEGLLSYDGTFEMKVVKQDEGFKIMKISIFPRLILKNE